MTLLEKLHREFTTWAQDVDHSEPGWQVEFPCWSQLISAAKSVLIQQDPTASDVRVLMETFAADAEDEEMRQFAQSNAMACFPLLVMLADAGPPACRWQVYDAISSAGPAAEPILRRGLRDSDPYARRRAVLALARLAPKDAPDLARVLLRDSDPYIRQAAIDLVLAAGDPELSREARAILDTDPVLHVRTAAAEIKVR